MFIKYCPNIPPRTVTTTSVVLASDSQHKHRNTLVLDEERM